MLLVWLIISQAPVLASEAKGTSICAGEQCRQMQESLRLPAGQVFVPAQSVKAAPLVTKKKAAAKGLQDRIATSSARTVSPDDASKAPSNLPSYLETLREPVAASQVRTDGEFFMTFSGKRTLLKDARAGSVFRAVIDQAILVSPSTPNPITATITSGPLSGATILGEASFGRELKCILLNFSLIKSKEGDATYQLKAVGTAPSGEACLEGEYESQNGRFFLAELLATGTAVMVDSQVSRSQNALDNYVEESSLANAGKKALAASMTKTAEHAAEGMKTAPEFTRLPGFQEIRVIFQTDPVEN
jgi:hypothetical protein